MNHISRRNLIQRTLALSATSFLGSGLGQSSKPSKLASVGWSWEGQGFTGGNGLSIFGVGEGAKFWGLKKVFHMWNYHNDLVMEKLRPFEEVICEISSSRPIRCGDLCVQSHYDPALPTLLKETENAGRLSLKYPNIKGVYIDDTLGSQKETSLTPEQYGSVYSTMKKLNADLKLWALIFSDQLYKQDWNGFKPHMEVINLWVWNADDLPNLDRHIDRCREIFPDKPINLGCFLWDFPSMKFSKGNFEKGRAVPMDLLRLQWERLLKYVQAGTVAGFSILAAFQIDVAQEQARWIRDFIAAN